MPAITDPAHEFATLCTLIRPPSPKSGVEHLANIFKVEQHSHEFYEIIFSIIDRAWSLKSMLTQIDNAAHVAPIFERHIDNTLNAFRLTHLPGEWRSHGAPFLEDQNVSPIFALSAIIRPVISYPSLSDEERASLSEEVGTLIGWLEGHQIGEMDFIRQALIDGLHQFQFRLDRLNWLGWGYTLQSLRDVIGAYMALERGIDGNVENTTIEAMKLKVWEGIQKIYSSVGVAKDVYERGDFILRAYGAASIVANAKSGGIMGLLTFSG